MNPLKKFVYYSVQALLTPVFIYLGLRFPNKTNLAYRINEKVCEWFPKETIDEKTLRLTREFNDAFDKVYGNKK